MSRDLMQLLGLYVWVNDHRVVLDAFDRGYAVQSWHFLDPECPAFLRKLTGYPLGWNMADPETPAIFRKTVGFKLAAYHLEAES